MSDYFDYNSYDDSYEEPVISIAAPVHGYGAPAPTYGEPAATYGGQVSSYGGHGQSSYAQVPYHTSYQAVEIPVYDDYEYEESFSSKFAKGWQKAKDTLYAGYEDATKAVKGLCKY